MKNFKSIINNKNFIAHFDGSDESEKNKVLPSEMKDFLKIEPLIANKQFFVMKNYPSERVLQNDIVEFMVAHSKALNPLNQFLRDCF